MAGTQFPSRLNLDRFQTEIFENLSKTVPRAAARRRRGRNLYKRATPGRLHLTYSRTVAHSTHHARSMAAQDTFSDRFGHLASVDARPNIGQVPTGFQMNLFEPVQVPFRLKPVGTRPNLNTWYPLW